TVVASVARRVARTSSTHVHVVHTPPFRSEVEEACQFFALARICLASPPPWHGLEFGEKFQHRGGERWMAEALQRSTVRRHQDLPCGGRPGVGLIASVVMPSRSRGPDDKRPGGKLVLHRRMAFGNASPAIDDGTVASDGFRQAFGSVTGGTRLSQQLETA